MQTKIGFIGAGKVGVSLGKFFRKGGLTVTGYYNRHREAAQAAAEFTESRCFDSAQAVAEASDAIFLTVPDNQIQAVYESLCGLDLRGKKICHCSGALSAEEAFPDVADLGATGYSIHPLFPVSDKWASYKELGSAFFCVEGTGPLDFWVKTLESLGAKVQEISGDAKVKYHAACVFSSNLVCALVDTGLNLLQECGFTEAGAREALAPLALSNMKHLLEDGPVQALTGPVERGDSETVRKHLSVLGDGPEAALYRAASEALISIAERKNPDRDYAGLRRILE